MRDDRGQSITLEAVTGAVLLLTAVLFTLQATALTPLTASTANQQIEEQNRALADDLLDTEAENGTLTDTVLYYNTTSEKYGPGDLNGFPDEPPGAFGDTVSRTFGSQNVAYNIYVEYQDKNGVLQREKLVFQGAPSDNAVAASKTVVLYDDMEITEPGNNMTLSEDPNFFAPDLEPNNPVYAVVEVKIVVWKM